MSWRPAIFARKIAHSSNGSRDSLLERDDYFVLADFGSYVGTQILVSSKFMERGRGREDTILNIARIGRFSSDRTVTEYARDIWHLNQV